MVECPLCEGCKKVVKEDKGYVPWTAYLNLPLQSSFGVLSGIIKPISCPNCVKEKEV